MVGMDLPVGSGGVLEQPTRARLFALLGELCRAACTDELAGRLGLHPNGVRLHLERLHEAGLVVRNRERHPLRGRPRDLWAISPSARPGGQPPTGYAHLARWLARALVAGDAQVPDVEATGRQIGRELVTGGEPDHREQQFYDALVSLGFAPERRPAAHDQHVYRLCNCPYRDVVAEHQPLVCGLHRGLTQGLVDATDADIKLTGFEPKDPKRAGCMIELRESPATTESAGHACAGVA